MYYKSKIAIIILITISYPVCLHAARFYDPDTGRFLQRDTVDDGPSPYVYVRNNPLIANDPTGHVTNVAQQTPDPAPATIITTPTVPMSPVLPDTQQDADILTTLGITATDDGYQWRIEKLGVETLTTASNLADSVQAQPEGTRDTYLMNAIYTKYSGSKYNLAKADSVWEMGSPGSINSDSYFSNGATVCYHSTVMLYAVDKFLGNPNVMITSSSDSTGTAHAFNLRQSLDSSMVSNVGHWQFMDATWNRMSFAITNPLKQAIFNTVVDTTGGAWPSGIYHVPSTSHDPFSK